MSNEGKTSPVEVADRLHSAAIHLLRAAREVDKAAPIGPAQLSALSVLVFGGPRSTGELAAAEQVRSATMSGIVAALEAGGLVERVPNPNDGRSTLIHASASGKATLQAARKRRITAIQSRLQRLSSRELALLGKAAALIEEVTVGDRGGP
jgi:DNA-binding MarR family transcriptional regulator